MLNERVERAMDEGHWNVEEVILGQRKYRERERETVCVCVCERIEMEGKREGEREGERELRERDNVIGKKNDGKPIKDVPK
jgi:hypothetical protein